MLTMTFSCFKIDIMLSCINNGIPEASTVRRICIMKESTIGFIGLGLIGGSIARGLKRADSSVKIMAYMRTRAKLEQAKSDGVIDIILDGVDETLSQCDMIFLCTPVEYNASYLEKIRPYLKPGAILTDVGSTKTDIHETVAKMEMDDVFVGGHPMAGSEKTGYECSTDHLLENAYYVITPTEKSTREQIARMTQVASAIGAIPLVLDYRQHDYSVAAISHLPHLIASSLVNLVRDNDSPDGTMRRIAAGGFKDITRIASSSPVMWEQICMTNTENLKTLLKKYISSLEEIYGQLDSHDSPAIHRLFDESGKYRSSISDYNRGPVATEYSFSVDIVDEPGSISTLSVILASKGINIKNIGINYSREYGEGALRITFYNEESRNAAQALLAKYNYTLAK